MPDLRDAASQVLDDIDEWRLEADVEVPRPRQIDGAAGHDPARPRAHDMYGVGEERGFAQVVRDEDDGESDSGPESRSTHHNSSRVNASRAANGSSSISRAGS